MTEQNGKNLDESIVALSDKNLGYESPMVVSELFDNYLYTGFFGRLDSMRVRSVTELILNKIDQYDAHYLIMDLSNVEFVDSSIAAHLINVANTIKLVGVKPSFCGIQPMVALTMSRSKISLEEFTIHRNLKTAIAAIKPADH